MSFLGGLLGRKSQPKAKAALPWGFIHAGWGETVVCLPASVPRLTNLVLVPGAAGEASHLVGHTLEGKPARVALAPLPEQAALADLRSVIVAVGFETEKSHLAIARVDPKGQKPVRMRTPEGKVFAVTVERILDDGRHDGTWRGFVALDNGVGNVALSLEPAFPLPVGAQVRIVGNLDPDTSAGPRFLPGTWVKAIDRLTAMARGLSWNFACAPGKAGPDPEAMAAITAVAGELREYETRRRGLGEPAAYYLLPFGQAPSRHGLAALDRMNRYAANHPGAPARGVEAGAAPEAAKRSRIKAIQWGGARAPDGDCRIDLQGRSGPKPAEAFLSVRKEPILSADGQPCRMALRIHHEDGSIEKLLLAGDDPLVDAIARTPKVLVVEGMDQAKNLGELVMYVAAVAGEARAA